MADVARLLGLPSEEAARKFVARYGIPHAKVGRNTFVLLESLISYLKTKESTVDADAFRTSAHGDQDALQDAAAVVRRRRRLDLREAAHRLAGKVAENPKD